MDHRQPGIGAGVQHSAGGIRGPVVHGDDTEGEARLLGEDRVERGAQIALYIVDRQHDLQLRLRAAAEALGTGGETGTAGVGAQTLQIAARLLRVGQGGAVAGKGGQQHGERRK